MNPLEMERERRKVSPNEDVKRSKRATLNGPSPSTRVEDSENTEEEKTKASEV